MVSKKMPEGLNLMELRDYLHFKRITILDFAKKVDIHRGTLSLILNGKQRAGKRLAVDIERVTNGEVTVAEVLALYKKSDNSV